MSDLSPPMPHNIEAEQMVLGTLLQDNRTMDRVTGRMSKELFFDPVHAAIYERIYDRIDAGLLASPVTLRSDLAEHPGLKELGGPAYLVRMAGLPGTGGGFIGEYVDLLADLRGKREILSRLREAREKILGGVQTATEIAVKLESQLGALASKTTTRPLMVSHLRAVTDAVMQINAAYQGESKPGLSTGITRLDSMLNFMRPGQMIVLAGRPAMGKTTVAQHMAFGLAEANVGVLYASLEMPSAELAVRFLSRGLSGRGHKIPYKNMIAGDLTEAEMRAVVEEAKRQQVMPMRMAERHVREIGTMRATARRMAQEMADTPVPLGIVIIDYLQLLSSEKARSAYDRVSEASDFCKSLALDLGVPVVALSQLSRDVERREPPVPMLADMRESGKLEEDADVVLFCYRQEYYTQRALDGTPMDRQEDRASLGHRLEQERGKIDIIVGKQRSGPTGTANAFVDLGCCHLTTDRAAEPGFLI